MKSALFDTNILIDAANGYQEAFAEFAFWRNPLISVITMVELCAGTPPDQKQTIIDLVNQIGFEIIHTDSLIMDIAARIRSARNHHYHPRDQYPPAAAALTAILHVGFFPQIV